MTLKCSLIFNELCNSGVETNENEIMMKAETEDGPIFIVSVGCRNPAPPKSLQASTVFNLVIFLEQVGGL